MGHCGWMQVKDAIGRYGERIAVRCLVDAGHQIIETNWRCARGEIDIVARIDSTVVFCEVKTRTSVSFGDPAEAVNAVKLRRLRALGLQWLADHPGHWDEIRFDVVSVLYRNNGPARVRHLRGAF